MDLIGQQETARRERDARMAKADGRPGGRRPGGRGRADQDQRRSATSSLRGPRPRRRPRPPRRAPRRPGRSPRPRRPRRSPASRPSSPSSRPPASRRSCSPAPSARPRPRPRRRSGAPRARRAPGSPQAQAEAERVKLAGQAEAAVTITKGEAQARVIRVNAEARPKQTTLEGNAEAGIVFTKGEAEAKALALRAEAYRQFNEAAIIQTVLSMLPEIVRAAAEPMANIDSLTVLSNDGASEVVKNATRTVTEASATVKGLTGHRHPAAAQRARWAPARAARPTEPARPKRGPSGGGGLGRWLARAAGGSGGSGGRPVGRRPRRLRRHVQAVRPGAEHRWRGRGGRRSPRATADDPRRDGLRPGAPRRPGAHRPSSAGAGRGHDGVRRPTARPPRPRRISPACRRRCRRCRPCPTSGRPTGGAAAKAAAGAVGLDEASTLSDSAVKLAEELRRVPGIERFGGTRLRDLERSGPRTLRTLWGAARDELETRYGDVTIGMLLDEYERSSGGGAPGPSH